MKTTFIPKLIAALIKPHNVYKIGKIIHVFINFCLLLLCFQQVMEQHVILVLWNG